MAYLEFGNEISLGKCYLASFLVTVVLSSQPWENGWRGKAAASSFTEGWRRWTSPEPSPSTEACSTVSGPWAAVEPFRQSTP